jgi:hypothetical protein
MLTHLHRLFLRAGEQMTIDIECDGWLEHPNWRETAITTLTPGLSITDAAVWRVTLRKITNLLVHFYNLM